MSQHQASTSSSGSGGGGGNIELGASLLITGSSKYSKIWCRSLYIGFLISLKKPTTTAASGGGGSYEESPLSSLPYTSLPPTPTRTSSSKSSIAIDICSHHANEEEEGEEALQQQHIRNDILRIVKEKDLRSLLELGGVDRVCHVLHAQSQHSNSEKSSIDHNIGTSFSGFLWSSCKHNRYTISMLLISAFLSFATEFKQEGPRYGWHDGVATVFAVLLLVAFSSITNFWRERKVAKRSKGEEVKFKVERGGEESQFVDLAISDIVVGDKIFLRPHDEVPADGLLVSDGEILVQVEGMKREKIGHERRNPFLIAGSKVIEGDGCMLVTSSVGNKSSNLFEIKKRGLLESLIEKPISYIDKASLFVFTLVAFVVFVRLICNKDGDNGGLPETKGNVSVGLLMQVLERIFFRPPARISILTGLFTVAILCVQHGVPLVVTISLNYQIDKLVPDQGAVLNDLSACTTMGLVTVICIDVSGELISKPVEVSRIWMGERETDISSKVEEECSEDVLDKLKQGVGLSVLAPELSLSPISNSLVSWAEKTWEMDITSSRENFDILEHGKLNSDQEVSGILVRKVRANEQVLHLHWSGDASTILDMCSQFYDSEGKCLAMGNHQKMKFGQVIKEMEENGLKTIAFAYKQTQVQELEKDEMTLLALMGLKYKCQESTKSALENLKNIGIQIKLVSDDDILLVKDIANELGIQVPVDGGHLEGKQLQDLNDKARLVKVDKAIVMGSFTPEAKLLMVQCLQDKGDVVAFIEHSWLMTNHTSAEVLKVADVGIVFNSQSRVMNRESCGICITCFSALKPIVRAGRSKYHNIQKFIQLQLTASISGLLITLITTMSTGKSPLTAIQLIWLNVLMCLLGGLMMAMELSSEEELVKKPSDRNQPIITKKIWKNLVIQVLYQASACMILEFGGHVTDSEKKVRKTMIFNTFLLCQLFNLLNTMDLLKKEVFKIGVMKNLYCFSVALCCCFVMQFVVIEYAKGLADCMQLNAAGWAICVLVGALSWISEWTLKKILSVILSTNYVSPPLESPPESTSQPWFYLYWSFPFMMLLLFPLGLIYRYEAYVCKGKKFEKVIAGHGMEQVHWSRGLVMLDTWGIKLITYSARFAEIQSCGNLLSAN